MMVVFLFVLTFIIYSAGFYLYKRKKVLWLNPLFTCSALIIAVLVISHTDYTIYEQATKPISFLLGPFQVAMVIPLIKYAKKLRKQMFVVATSVFAGSFTGVISAFFIGELFHLDPKMLISMIPKAITAPVALETSQTIGGSPELTALFVIFTGVTGILIGPFLLNKLGIKNNQIKGLALGTSAQMLGAAHAAEWGEAEGTMGFLGMLLSAIMIGIIIPMLFLIY